MYSYTGCILYNKGWGGSIMYLDQTSIQFFCNMSDEKHFRLCKSHVVSITYSLLFIITFVFNWHFYWRIITLQYCYGFCHTSAWRRHRYTCVPLILNPLPSPSPLHLSRLSQSTSSACSASCIKHELVIYFTFDNIYVSMLLSHIIPPSPSSTESESLFFTSVSSWLPWMFTIAMIWKQLRCPPANKWIRNLLYIHNGILNSYKKELIWVSSSELDEPQAYYTEGSKSERERIILYINTVIWNIK